MAFTHGNFALVVSFRLKLDQVVQFPVKQFHSRDYKVSTVQKSRRGTATFPVTKWLSLFGH